MDRRVTAEQGFTLIELMIAMAVLAALATTVTLAIARPDGTERGDWARFVELHDRVRAEAAVSQQLLALAVDGQGYQRLTWADGWEEAGPRVAWQQPVTVLVPFRGDQPLEFAPGGQVTQFRLQFGTGSVTRTCESDGWGPVTCRGG